MWDISCKDWTRGEIVTPAIVQTATNIGSACSYAAVGFSHPGNRLDVIGELGGVLKDEVRRLDAGILFSTNRAVKASSQSVDRNGYASPKLTGSLQTVLLDRIEALCYFPTFGPMAYGNIPLALVVPQLLSLLTSYRPQWVHQGRPNWTLAVILYEAESQYPSLRFSD